MNTPLGIFVAVALVFPAAGHGADLPSQLRAATTHATDSDSSSTYQSSPAPTGGLQIQLGSPNAPPASNARASSPAQPGAAALDVGPSGLRAADERTECRTDADCIPSTCCHPKSAVNKKF